ncbi:hypothetical protein PC129_g7689 [Phytophthora cactorum]|uniref:Uncharacterized protein n=2 Tax=Phytophthora cactorum TaxID=29920 RepID=A0A8T1IB29_9STRA|nr:hypothetical protein PC129_g7689 [Phytophthora cactorum]
MDDVLPSLLDLNGEELYVLLTLYDHPDRPIIPDIRFNLASLADQTLRRNSALMFVAYWSWLACLNSPSSSSHLSATGHKFFLAVSS